jgi:hypothetical protein
LPINRYLKEMILKRKIFQDNLDSHRGVRMDIHLDLDGIKWSPIYLNPDGGYPFIHIHPFIYFVQ